MSTKTETASKDSEPAASPTAKAAATVDAKDSQDSKKNDSAAAGGGSEGASGKMHLPSAHPPNPSSVTGVPLPASSSTPQQHSPGGGSTSSVSSNGSSSSGGNGVGYTRQSNPRPRKHVASVSTTSSGVVVSSSLPPSAVTAPPYVPTSSMEVEYSQPAQTFVSTGSSINASAPPFTPASAVGGHQTYADNSVSYAPSGPVYFSPYVPEFVPAAAANVTPLVAASPVPSMPPPPRGVPPPIHGPLPKGPPNVINQTGSCSSGRYTPSPHSVSGSSSPCSFMAHNVGSTNGAANTGQHVVNYHVLPGEVISLQLAEGQVQVIPGRSSTSFYYTRIALENSHISRCCRGKT
jgi:hypothetical protein